MMSSSMEGDERIVFTNNFFLLNYLIFYTCQVGLMYTSLNILDINHSSEKKYLSCTHEYPMNHRLSYAILQVLYCIFLQLMVYFNSGVHWIHHHITDRLILVRYFLVVIEWKMSLLKPSILWSLVMPPPVCSLNEISIRNLYRWTWFCCFIL